MANETQRRIANLPDRAASATGCLHCGKEIIKAKVSGYWHWVHSANRDSLCYNLLATPADRAASAPQEDAAAAAPVPAEWQPIETAPKDGTKVLIFVSSDDDGECHKIAYWSDLAARPGWFYRGGWLEENEPDGWQPLPAPPKEDHHG